MSCVTLLRFRTYKLAHSHASFREQHLFMLTSSYSLQLYLFSFQSLFFTLGLVLLTEI